MNRLLVINLNASKTTFSHFWRSFVLLILCNKLCSCSCYKLFSNNWLSPMEKLLQNKLVVVLVFGPSQHSDYYWVRHICCDWEISSLSPLCNATLPGLHQCRIKSICPHFHLWQIKSAYFVINWAVDKGMQLYSISLRIQSLFIIPVSKFMSHVSNRCSCSTFIASHQILSTSMYILLIISLQSL